MWYFWLSLLQCISVRDASAALEGILEVILAYIQCMLKTNTIKMPVEHFISTCVSFTRSDFN